MKHLNVLYETIKFQVNVTGWSKLDQIEEAVKKELDSNILVSPVIIQLYTANKTLIRSWADVESLSPEYFAKEGSYVIAVPLNVSPVISDDRPLKRIKINPLTNRLESFTSSQLINGCIESPDENCLPLPGTRIKKLFVRKCYEDVFELLVQHIELGTKSFGISGTPGIGKSLFFLYILYRLIKDPTVKSRGLNPRRIVYQIGTSFHCFDLQEYTVKRLLELDIYDLLQEDDTLYIIDGFDSRPCASECIAIFISSPISEQYKHFVKQKSAKCWYFPVWTLEELSDCREKCYPDIDMDTLTKIVAMYGGIARVAFQKALDLEELEYEMKTTLKDTNAIRDLCNTGSPKITSEASYTLLHLIVTDDGKYRFSHMDVASKYVNTHRDKTPINCSSVPKSHLFQTV